MRMAISNLLTFWLCAGAVTASLSLPRDYASDDPLTKCPGYSASDVQTRENGLTAKLSLAGPACNVYGDDLHNLTLTVTYETGGLPT